MITENQTIESRAKYVEAWNTTMTQIWQERILKYGVFESPRRRTRASDPHLYDSLHYFPVKHDEQYIELAMHFTFPEYGIFQDRGTGREKYLGNPGDIEDFTKSGRKRKFRDRRPWFSIKWYASCMNIKEFMARSIGDQFVGIVSASLGELNK